jgi:putative hydrolase of the HAD superfamily
VATTETVFMDAGGVLVHPNWRRVADTLARHGQAVDVSALERADRAVRRSTDTVAGSRHVSDDARVSGYFYSVLAAIGIPRSPAVDDAVGDLRRYHAEHNLWEWVPDDVRPALDRLRGLGLRLVIVSNANGTLHDHLARLELLSYFDAVLDSFVEGFEKPDPRLFEAALKRVGARAATTVHVGDLYYVDVAGARLAGLRPVLLDPDDLYPEADCERVRSLQALVDLLRHDSGPIGYA